MNDQDYMKLALELAERGRGYVNPNPMVGAVIVKDGEIIGSGYHERCGGPHAERNALASCKKSPEGATIYVTLEPCCHWGKTPPCTDAILESGIVRVVVGMQDPNPLVAGKGIEALRVNGILVDVGVMEAECREQNQVFFYQIQNSTPFVALKYAMTLDGKIATETGESMWITGEKARRHAHGLRHQYSTILVGIGTVLADDPMLNCRVEGGRNPVRVICDTNLRISMESRIVQTADEIPTYIAHDSENEEKIGRLKRAGCRMLSTGRMGSHIDLSKLMDGLFREGIDSVLCEGGSAIHFNMLNSGLANKVYAYIAPKLIGGEGAKSPIGGEGIKKLSEARLLQNRKTTVLGEDILLEYDLVRSDTGRQRRE